MELQHEVDNYIAGLHRDRVAYNTEIHKAPYVAITIGKDEWFFQGEEAAELIGSIPEDINEEDFLVWLASGWGV